MSKQIKVIEVIGVTQEFLEQRAKIRTEYNVLEEITGCTLVQLPQTVQLAGAQPKVGVMLSAVIICEEK